jgi:hypothetical protein
MTSEFITTKKSSSETSFLAKLFVWSILLHPLLFFDIAHEHLIGIGGQIAKILDLIVCLCVFFCFIFFKSYTIKIDLNTRLYWIYFFYTIVVGLFGFLFGYYSVNESSFITSGHGFFNLRAIRPVTEYVITIFYFVYFVVLGAHFLSNDRTINYFFKIFFFLFYANLILGFLDLFFTYFYNIDLVPVSLIRDSTTSIRFHGLAGEPRDAFVYLIFGIGMIYLYDAWKMQKKQRPILISSSILAIMLTASVSGIIGLIISIVFFVFYSISTFNSKKILMIMTISFIILILIYLNVRYGYNRYASYLHELPGLFNNLRSNADMSNVIFLGQLPNIYPLFARYLELSELNILPTFFGTGIGSESIININFIRPSDNVLNPHSQAIRLFYSSGIIGSILYVMAFFLPVYKISKKYKSEVFIYLVLLILGVSLGHRSVVVFIFLGVFLAVFKQLSKNLKKIETY